MFKNSVLYSVGELFPRLISLILLPVFTRFLSPGDYGIVMYVNSILAFVTIISTLSLNTYFARNYFTFVREGNRKTAIWTISSFIFLFNIILTGAFFLAGPYLLNEFNVQVSFYPYFSLALIFNFLEAISVIPMGMFRIEEKALPYVLTNTIKTFLQCIIIYVLIVYYHKGALGNFYGRLWVSILFSVFFAAIIIKNSSFKFNTKLLKEGLRFSLPVLPAAFSYLLLGMSDRLIMERYLALSDLGIYSIAYTISFALTVVVQGGYRAFEPVVYKQFGTGDFAGTVSKINAYFMASVFAVAVGICMFSKELILLMANEKYASAYWYIPGLVIGFCFNAQSLLHNTILTAEGRTPLISKATGLGAIISIVINVILIPILGIWGAVWASIAAFAAMYFFASAYVKNLFSFKKQLYFSVLLVVLISAAVYLLDFLSFFVLLGIKIAIAACSVLLIAKIYNIRLLAMIRTYKNART